MEYSRWMNDVLECESSSCWLLLVAAGIVVCGGWVGGWVRAHQEAPGSSAVNGTVLLNELN